MRVTRDEVDLLLARIAYLEVCLTGTTRGPARTVPPDESRAAMVARLRRHADLVGRLLGTLRSWDDVDGASLRTLIRRLRGTGHQGDDRLFRVAVHLRWAELGLIVDVDPRFMHLIGR